MAKDDSTARHFCSEVAPFGKIHCTRQPGHKGCHSAGGGLPAAPHFQLYWEDGSEREDGGLIRILKGGPALKIEGAVEIRITKAELFTSLAPYLGDKLVGEVAIFPHVVREFGGFHIVVGSLGPLPGTAVEASSLLEGSE